MKEKYSRCLLCDKFMMTDYREKKGFRNEDTIRVKGDLFGKYFDEVLHEKCFKKFNALERNSE